jgi:putative membrane protein
MRKVILILIAVVLAINTSKAQAPDPDTTAKHFLIMASIGNLQEISAGELASQKATISGVKSFGQEMVQDHGESEKRLLHLAKLKGYDLPAPATEKPTMDLNLLKANGKDFDRLYIHNTVPGHISTISMFENYAVTGKDPDVRAFAQQMLPIFKHHLEMIKMLDEENKYLVAQ